MDPALASVLGTTIVTIGAVIVAVINALSSGERVKREALIDRLKKRLIVKHGEDPADVEDL